MAARVTDIQPLRCLRRRRLSRRSYTAADRDPSHLSTSTCWRRAAARPRSTHVNDEQRRLSSGCSLRSWHSGCRSSVLTWRTGRVAGTAAGVTFRRLCSPFSRGSDICHPALTRASIRFSTATSASLSVICSCASCTNFELRTRRQREPVFGSVKGPARTGREDGMLARLLTAVKAVD